MDKINQILFEKEIFGHKEFPILRDTYAASEYAIETMLNTGHLTGHDECINAIAFNRDGSLLVSGSDDETIRVWDFYNKTTIDTLFGHSTNVFSVEFLPFTENGREVISGGNDSDVRYFDRVARSSTVYTHHTKKVLRVATNPIQPNCIMSCSSDGTVRMFDIRQKYENSYIQQIPTIGNHTHDEFSILPQMFGGGRAIDRFNRPQKESLVLDFDKDQVRAQRYRKSTIYSVEFHPFDGHTFATASSDGTARLFDLRKIKDYSANSYINIFRNIKNPFPTNNEAMYATFSKNGEELLVTNISESLYLYDIKKNYEKELNIDYFKSHATKKKRRAKSSSGSRQRKRQVLDHSEDNTNNDSDSNNNNNINSSSNEESETSHSHESVDVDEDEVDDEDDEENEESGPSTLLEYTLQDVLEDYYHDLLDDYENTDSEEEDDDEIDSEEDEQEKEELNTEDNNSIVKSYVQEYSGHLGGRTIKSCAFYGPNSEYIMTGSDDHRIFIWEKISGKLIRILEGPENIVNTCIAHPSLPIIVSSGLDNDAFIFEPEDEYPSKKILKQRKKKLNFLTSNQEHLRRNRMLDEEDYSYIEPSCIQQ